MKKKINTSHKSINKFQIPEQKPISNNTSINNEFFSIFKKFCDSFYKYIQSMRNCLKEINSNISNNLITLDESSNKCISSLNIIFSYLDSSFNQFYTNIQNFLELINYNKFSKISNSSKKPGLSKNYISTHFYNDNNNSNNNNFKNNSIYSNYQQGKIEKKNYYRYGIINKNNTTTDLKNTNSIEEKFYRFHIGSDLNDSNNNNNINEGNSILINKNFVENVKNLLNILKYERISDIGSNTSRKSKYQEKLDNFKESLISDLTNTINDTQDSEKNPVHRRIKSVNLNSNTFNFINNINNDNENKINDFIIQDSYGNNLNDISDNKNKSTTNKASLYFLDNNNINDNLDTNEIYEFKDNNRSNNLNIIKKTKTENEKLKNENNLLENNKKELLIQIADLINKNNTLNEEINILKNNNLKKDEIEKELNKKINELNNKIEIITNSKNEIEKLNQQLKKSIDTCQNEKSAQIKEIKKLKDNLEDLKKKNKKLNNDISEIKVDKKKIKELKKEIDDLNKEISELVKENGKLSNEVDETNNRKEEYKEKYKKAIKELSDEKEINALVEQKVKNLERKLEEYNINEYDDEKTKTYKISNINKVNEIEVEKLSRKYVSPSNYRKNTSAFSTNNTSNNRKILINNNIDDLEITPENFIIVKYFQLNNNFKWYLLKKIKKINEPEPSPTSSPSQSNSKPLYRRYKYLKLNSKVNNDKNNESYSDFIWKPSRNERDFINFNFINNDNNNNDNNKNENSNDWQKKINELEYCIKDLEEKLEKKENDCNRINLNYAKLFKRTKQPENYDKLLENNEKLKTENKSLKKTIDNLKSTQNFIGLSFIEDDLEGSRFIDDNCFEDILDGLVGNTNRKNNTYKRNNNENKFEINMMKFFKSHGDDNENKDLLNDENNNTNKNENKNDKNDKNSKNSKNDNKNSKNENNKNDNSNKINSKKNIKEENNDDNKKNNVKKEKRIHLFFKDDKKDKIDKIAKDDNNDKIDKNDKSDKIDKNDKNDKIDKDDNKKDYHDNNNIKNNNIIIDYNKLKTYKKENRFLNDHSNENITNKYDKYRRSKFDTRNTEKNNNIIDNSNNEKNNEILKSDNKKNDNNKKYSSYRFNRYKLQSNNNAKSDTKYESDLNNKIDNNNNKDENKNKDKDKEKYQIKSIVMKKNYFQDEKNKRENNKVNLIIKENNEELNNKEKRIYINKLTDIISNKKTENDQPPKNVYTHSRRVRNSYKINQDINNETDHNNNINNNYNDNKRFQNLYAKKEDIKEKEKESKPYRSLKSMKIESEIKIEKGMKESSSQTNRVCLGRRFYKRKQEDIKNEIKE